MSAPSAEPPPRPRGFARRAPRALPSRRPGIWATVGALLRKELLVELRTLESVPGMSLFAVTTFVVFHFALNQNTVSATRPRGSSG